MKNRREKKYIFQLMLRYKKELILNAVLSFFLLAIYMVTPILEQKIIDEGILSKDYVILLKLVFIATFIGIVGYFIQYIQMHIQSGVAAAVSKFSESRSSISCITAKDVLFKKT